MRSEIISGYHRLNLLPLKRENMVKSEEEEIKNRSLSRLRKKIETFSVADNFGLKFIRAVSRRGQAVKIILISMFTS